MIAHLHHPMLRRPIRASLFILGYPIDANSYLFLIPCPFCHPDEGRVLKQKGHCSTETSWSQDASNETLFLNFYKDLFLVISL